MTKKTFYHNLIRKKGCLSFWKNLDNIFAWSVCPFCKQIHLSPNQTHCSNCEKLILQFPNKKRCFGCGGINEGFLDLCPECCQHGGWPWLRGVTAFPYETFIREAIHQYKYQNKTYFLPFFAQATANAWRRYGSPAKPNYISDVPMHWTRRLKRGYNQAELLARYLANILNIPYLKTATRAHYTPQQAKLNKKQRSKNLHHAFVPYKPKRWKNQSILLVDDVFTTGNTLTECSKCLISAGAAEINVLTIAKDE